MNRERGFAGRIDLHTDGSSGTTSNDLNQADIDVIALQDLNRSLPVEIITHGAGHRDSAPVDRRMTGKVRRSAPESFFIRKQVPQDFSERNNAP